MCVRCGTPVNVAGQCPKCMAKDDPEERFMYRLGERVFLTAKDDGGACGEVIGQEHGELPPAIGGGMEERVNVRLDDGTVTGFIPITLVRLLKDQRPVAEQTHDPVQGLPSDDDAGVGVASGGNEWDRAEVYLRGNPKTPKALEEVADELVMVAPVLKPKEGVCVAGTTVAELARKSAISAAIMARGCARAWRAEQSVSDNLSPTSRQHKLLFFGPSICDGRVAEEMKKTGTLPESEMDDRINQMMREGWRVVFRHFDPSFHVQRWRIVLEKP